MLLRQFITKLLSKAEMLLLISKTDDCFIGKKRIFNSLNFSISFALDFVCV